MIIFHMLKMNNNKSGSYDLCDIFQVLWIQMKALCNTEI